MEQKMQMKDNGNEIGFVVGEGNSLGIRTNIDIDIDESIDNFRKIKDTTKFSFNINGEIKTLNIYQAIKYCRGILKFEDDSTIVEEMEIMHNYTNYDYAVSFRFAKSLNKIFVNHYKRTNSTSPENIKLSVFMFIYFAESEIIPRKYGHKISSYLKYFPEPIHKPTISRLIKIGMMVLKIKSKTKYEIYSVFTTPQLEKAYENIINEENRIKKESIRIIERNTPNDFQREFESEQLNQEKIKEAEEKRRLQYEEELRIERELKEAEEKRRLQYEEELRIERELKEAEELAIFEEENKKLLEEKEAREKALKEARELKELEDEIRAEEEAKAKAEEEAKELQEINNQIETYKQANISEQEFNEIQEEVKKIDDQNDIIFNVFGPKRAQIINAEFFEKYVEACTILNVNDNCQTLLIINPDIIVSKLDDYKNKDISSEELLSLIPDIEALTIAESGELVYFKGAYCPISNIKKILWFQKSTLSKLLKYKLKPLHNPIENVLAIISLWLFDGNITKDKINTFQKIMDVNDSYKASLRLECIEYSQHFDQFSTIVKGSPELLAISLKLTNKEMLDIFTKNKSKNKLKSDIHNILKKKKNVTLIDIILKESQHINKSLYNDAKYCKDIREIISLCFLDDLTISEHIKKEYISENKSLIKIKENIELLKIFNKKILNFKIVDAVYETSKLRGELLVEFIEKMKLT